MLYTYLVIFLLLKIYIPESHALPAHGCYQFYFSSSLGVADQENTRGLIKHFETITASTEKYIKILSDKKNDDDLELRTSIVEEMTSLLNEAYLLKDSINSLLELSSDGMTTLPTSLINKLKVINKIKLPETIQKLIELQVIYPKLDFKTLTIHTQVMQEKQRFDFFRKFELQPLTTHGQILLENIQRHGTNLTKQKIKDILLEKDAHNHETGFIKKISFADFKLLLAEVFYKEIDLEKIITESESKNNILEVINQGYYRQLVAFYFRAPRLSHFSHPINCDKCLNNLNDVNRDFKNLSFLINITDFNLLDPNNKEILLMTAYFKKLLDAKFKGIFGGFFNRSSRTTRHIYNEALEGLNLFISSSDYGLSIDKRDYIENLNKTSSPFYFQTSLGKVKVLAFNYLLSTNRDFYEK
ncbi:MAG: hypothetical protein L6Q37_05655 [Bdellovibrionaceae bacterium]|nr:hypothetical protein [Pseudobdellovibrionaceae bacterium]NUM57950.1 hypothetical protein [Pseudobdellovibrionaceae bacterium]